MLLRVTSVRRRGERGIRRAEGARRDVVVEAEARHRRPSPGGGGGAANEERDGRADHVAPHQTASQVDEAARHVSVARGQSRADEVAEIDRDDHAGGNAPYVAFSKSDGDLRRSGEEDALRQTEHRARDGNGHGAGAEGPGGGSEGQEEDRGNEPSSRVHVRSFIYNAPLRTSSAGTKVTPCGVGIGVGSGRTNGAPESSSSQRRSMALSSCTVLWQCSMNIPPQSRNCMVILTLPPGRSRYTSLRPFSQAGTLAALPSRARI